VLVGADASGLELRCLAHYLHNWDDGAYTKEILTGDIHTANRIAMGLETRDQAKTAIYCLIYGGGDARLGSISNGGAKEGKRLKASFVKKVPAYRRLTEAVSNALEMKGMLRGIDGRPLPCRSPHSALNLLLQSAGAVIMKQALVEFVKMAKLPYEVHGTIHDEIQFSCAPEHADELGRTFCNALSKAGKTLKFNCPIDGEFSVGKNWKDTH
jgi:DNA polymerase I-like protein with 3'-5' exonuclease and polymerase domains